MNALDRLCLNGLAVSVAGMLGVLACAALPVESESRSVVLKPLAATCDSADFVCVLHAESLAKARPSQGKGYSERERSQMDQLIARLP